MPVVLTTWRVTLEQAAKLISLIIGTANNASETAIGNPIGNENETVRARGPRRLIRYTHSS